MTTMDSDSASQDSDDGRRFRFEATRKDSVVSTDTSSNTIKSPKKKSKHKFQCENSKHYRDEKKRLKEESSRKIDHKDFGHSIKHSMKHELRNSKQEDSKISSENHCDDRDASSGSASNDRDSKNFSGDDAWEKSRDSKWQTNRNRNVYRSQRSRECSYDRNYHDDRHRNRHERYKHHSRDGSWDRFHQSSRIKFSSSDYWSRDDHRSKKYDSLRKTSVKENSSQNLRRDHFSPKNIDQTHNRNDIRSSNNLKRNSSIEKDIQDCKELNLSQFDVLSKTDENASDNRNSRSRTSSPRSCKTKLKEQHSKNQFENSKKRTREDDDETSKIEQQKELNEIKQRNDTRSDSSNNNSSSDSSFGTVLSAILPIKTNEIYKNSEREKLEYCEQKEMIAYNCISKYSNLEEKYSQCLDVSLNDTQLLKRDAKRSGLTYGPLLPPGFVSDTSHSDKFERISPTVLDENKIDGNDKGTYLIEPRLLLQFNEEEETSIGKNIAISAAKTKIAIGPALPPHLLQQQCRDDSPDEIIGPVLPITKLCEKNSDASLESDNDHTMGPLPVDHPALRSSRVYEQLNLRAQKIRNERCLKMIDVRNQREEWMTDLPPVQTVNLGLGPRKFKLRDGPDISDRSCWTDTPAQKAHKQKDLKAKTCSSTIESDTKYMKEFLKEGSDKGKKRGKSLLEIHQKEVSKRKKNEEREAKRTGVSTRRPFDRNTDLQIRFDQAQKKTILLKAQLLDDRFSRGQI